MEFMVVVGGEFGAVHVCLSWISVARCFDVMSCLLALVMCLYSLQASYLWLPSVWCGTAWCLCTGQHVEFRIYEL